MPYAPLLSLFPITLEEAEEEEEVVTPPAMPYVPTSVPTPPPPSAYPRVIPPAPPFSSSPPLASPPSPVIPSPLPPSIPPAPATPSSSSSTAPPVGEGGIEVPPSVEITDGQRLETEQLQDESSMDGVQQSGGQEIEEQHSGEQQIGEERIEEQQMVDQQLGEQQAGEPQTGEQEMWGIRDGGRVLASGMITAPLRRSTRITRGIPPLKYAWALVVEPAGLDDEEEDEEWTDLDPDVVADPERQWDIAKMTVKEDLGCWKGDKVKEAMDEEMRSLIEQGTWKLGFTQVAGVDYEETYAPVGSYVIARVLLAIAAALDLDLMQLDVKNAFLHGQGFGGWRLGGGGCVASPAPPPPSSPTAAPVAEGGGCVGVYGVVLGGWSVSRARLAAPVARETVAPVAREPVAPVAREPVAPVARESVARLPLLLVAEPVTPVARVPIAPVASVPVAPVARVPVAPVAPCASSFNCRPLSALLS
ncbi:unnamed protein product [Closterium sp. NIES-54]